MLRGLMPRFSLLGRMTLTRLKRRAIVSPDRVALPRGAGETNLSNVVGVSPGAGMSFLVNVYAGTYRTACLNINGTSTYEMIRLLDQIDRDDMYDLQALARAMQGQINADRIDFCCDVVNLRAIPAEVPASCKAELPIVRQFLAGRSPLRIMRDPTSQLPAPVAGTAGLSLSDLQAAAGTLGVETAVMQAVSDIEAGGRSSFSADGRPIIRYELHVFRKETKAAYDTTHPHLSATYAVGMRGHDGAQASEWSLLYGAMMLRSGLEHAYNSASWGMFQIMGFNYAAAGYSTVLDFANAMCGSAGNQLQAFVSLCQTNNLTNYLVRHDWAGFARRYNGPDYATNRYDTRLDAAYRRHGGR